METSRPRMHQEDFVQGKIRLKKSTYELLKSYCEKEDLAQSKIIEKALWHFFKDDKEFANEHQLVVNDAHLISTSELEDKIFNRYGVMIRISAEQSEKIGIKLESKSDWPRCRNDYTLKEFIEKIVRKCLARVVEVKVIDARGNIQNLRTHVSKTREIYSEQLETKTVTIQNYYDAYNNAS